MCGLVGVYNKTGQLVDTTLIERMADMISHRGPDDSGTYINGAVGLGFRRLSIIDLQRGHQPICNEDGTVWVTFNGEIYNYVEIRQRLVNQGHRFLTDTDTEVLVHLYEEKGIDLIHELRGMFCFTIYDSLQSKVFVVRDPFGIKPCYYTETKDAVYWGSEVKSLLCVPDFSATVNLEAMWNYFTFQYVPDPLTMFSGIYTLPPAHYMVISSEKIDIQRYWEVQFEEVDEPVSYYVEGLLDRLRNSVSVHTRSDVSLGAFLSSGVDSSTIAALLRESGPVKTFTVGFAEPGVKSEIADAREIARRLETDHHDAVITPNQYLDTLLKAVYSMDVPVADPSAIALYIVAELASRQVTVVLSGEGADEIFGGYRIYREPISLRGINCLPLAWRRLLARSAVHLQEGVKGRSLLIRAAQTLPERYVGNAFIFGEEAKERLLVGNRLASSRPRFSETTKPFYTQAANYDDITKMQFIDLHTWLPGDILIKADKMTMAHSVELRVPFLDREVFDFAAKIPARYRMLKRTTKYVFRETAKQLLPNNVAERPKLGFPVPIRTWLRNEHYDWAKEVIESSRTGHLINKEYALQLLEEHRNGVRDNSRKVWTVLVFMLWHLVYIEQSHGSPYTPYNHVSSGG